MATLADCLKKTRRFLDPDDYTAIKESYEAALAQGMDEQTAVNEAVRPILNELLEARAAVVDQVDEAVGGNVDEMFAPPEAAANVAGAEGAAPSTAATDAAVLQDVREFAGDKRNYDGIPADQLDQAINAIGAEIADLIATRNGLQTEIETMQPSKDRRAKSREFKQVRADIKALEDELAAMAAARDVLDVEQPAPEDPAARALEEAQTMTETGQPAENWSDAALEAGLDNGLIRIDRDGAPRRAAQPDPEQIAAEQESRIESLMEGQLASLIQDASGEIQAGRLGQQEAVGDAVAIRRLVDSVALLSDAQIKAEFGKVARLARAANRPQLIARAIQGAMARDLRAREDAELSNAARDLIEQSVEDALEGKPVSETLETVMTDQVVEGVADEILNITKHMTLDGYTRVADRIAGVLDEIEPEVVSVVEAANDMPSQFSRARAVAEQAQAMGGRIVNVNVSALANDLFQTPRAAGVEYADRLEALRESAGPKKRAYLVESGGQPILMFPDGTEFRNPPPGSYYDVAAPIAAEASQALLGLIRGVANRIAKKSGVRAPERTIDDMLEAAEGSRAEKIATVLDEIGTDTGLYHDLTVDYLKEKRGGLTLAELQIVAHTYAGKTTKSRTKKDAIDAIEAEFNRRANAEDEAAVLAGDVGHLTRDGEQRSNDRRAAQRDQRLREGARALSDGGLSAGLSEDGEGGDAGRALAGDRRGSSAPVSDDGGSDQGQGARIGPAVAGGRADTEESSAAASQRDRDERDRAGAADDDIDIDAPNFGLPEPPRTLPDGHPLLTPHWHPENTELQDTSPERVAMRERLIEQRFEGKTPVADGQKPIAYLMGGGGASGKGTILKALIRDGYIDDSYVQLDPDSFKTGDTKLGWEGIPEYWEIDAAGDSRGATITHEESSHTYKQAQKRGIEGRYNVVLDQTLGTPHKGQALLKLLNDAGYEVRLIGVTVNPEMAIRRAVDRAKGPERRFVPLDQLLAAHKGFSNGFEAYAAAADSVMLFNTEVPRGADARLIAQGNLEDGLAISDQNAYNNFARKGALNEKANTIRQLRDSLEKAGLVQRLQAGHDGAGDQGPQGRAGAPGLEDRAGLSRDRVRTAALEAAKQADVEREERRRKNYQITDDDNLGAGGAKAKVRGNIEAIRIVRQLEEEGRPATTEEKQKLVKYVGWGAFAQDVFTDYKSEWAKERQQLKDLMSVEEYNAAKASTLNAHYTSKDVIDGMWKAMEHFGFEGGRAIEPAAGIGHFIGLTPKALAAKTDWVAVELDKITGAIAKHLYEGSDVRVQGFETAALPDGFFDLAISNVPFGNFKLEDTKHKGLLIHDYFFAKSLDKVRPGGMVAFITSMGTMDKVDDRVRRLIDAQADLVGAIRLPGGNQGAFKGNAGTDVTTDIIFLRKRVPGEGRNPDAPKWLDLKEIKTPEGKTRINRYFADHPDMMLGKMRLAGTMYRKDSPVLIGPSNNLGERIAEAAAKMPANVIAPRATTSQDVGAEPEILTDVGVKEGSLFVKGGKIYQNVQGKAVDQKVSGKNLTRLRGLIAMRDIYTDLLNAQISGKREDAPALREKLNKAYDAFFAKFGPINKTIVNVQTRKQKDGSVKEIITRRYPNLAGFNDDPDYFKLASIEHYDEETGKAFKKAVFSEDILAAYERPTVAGPADALAVSLNETGGIDMARIADMMGVTEPEAIAELGDRVYRDPNGERYELAELYLSGDVVKKLEDARAAAETDPSYQRNVTALEAVQPEPLTRVDIRVPFGAPWIPADIYNEFIAKVIGMRGGNVKYETVLSSWRFETPDKLKYSGYLNVAAQDAFGTDRVNVGDIVIAALNNKTITVKDKDSDGNEFVNVDATEQARAKIKLVQDTFSGDPQIGVLGWAFESEENAQKLEALYNRTYNRLVPTRYDGSHLTLPGLSETLTLPNGKIVPLDRSPHRVNAIWRAITTGNMLMDHAVGSGKTITAIAAVMEMKRLGMIQRPMFAVPNHMLEQFSREFLEAYPNAKILVADKKNMEAKNRKAFAGRIASEKWDGIIITHDAFGRIGMKEEAYAEFMEQEIKELLDAWISAKTAAGEAVNIDEFNAIGTASEKTKGRSKDPTVKEIERKKKTLETQIAKALAKDRKDTGLTFEDLGVDYLTVDEAHLFKNLTFNTSHANVKGLGVKGSQRAMDLFLKIRHIEKSRPGRSAIFMTGTPMSRSMAEIYTMQRYLQLDKLREYGIDRFDAWASTFGRIVTNTEQGITMKLKDVASFSKFVNVPELQQIYSLVTDSMTAEQLGLPRPDLKGGAPQVVLSEMSEGEVAETERLIAKMEALRGPVKKGEDNHLSLFTKTLQIATDMRLYDASAPFNPNGKIAKLVAKVAEIYKRGEYPALAQTIFLDMGVPTSKAPAKKKGKAKVADIGDTDAETDADPNAEADAEVEALLAGKFNLYQDIKDRLVAQGIPANEIAFIHDAKTDTAKGKLFKAVREGKVRVLLGSSSKMGVGTNIQSLLVAQHHVDSPWNPADLVQRDGRILRRGNQNKEVEIYRYITERSADAYRWQILARKAEFEAQFRAGARGLREAEDIDSPIPEASTLKALATGDPRILEHANLTREIRDMEAARRGHERSFLNAQRSLKEANERIAKNEVMAIDYGKDAELVTDISGDNFKIRIDTPTLAGETKKRKEAGEAIRAHVIEQARYAYSSREWTTLKVGQMSGLEMIVRFRKTADGLVIEPALKGAAEYRSNAGTKILTSESNPIGLMRAWENVLIGIPGLHKFVLNRIEEDKATVSQLEKRATPTPFPRADELVAAKVRHEQLEKELKAAAAKPEDAAQAPADIGETKAPTSREAAIAAYTDFYGREPPPRLSIKQMQDQIANDKARWAWQEQMMAPLRKGMEDEDDVLSALLPQSLSDRIRSVVGLGREAVKTDAMLGENDDGTPFVGGKEAAFQRDMRLYRLQQTLLEELDAAGRDTGRADGGGRGADAQGGAAAEGLEAAPAADTGGGQRDALGAAVQDPGFRARAIDAFLSPELRTEAIKARQEAQGWTVDGFHGTRAVFDDPNPFVPGRDFGFHVSIGNAHAANEILNAPTSFTDRMTKLLDRFQHRERGFRTVEEGANVVPLKIRAKNPLRLPHVAVVDGRWNDPFAVRELLRHPESTAPESLKRWADQWIRDNGINDFDRAYAVRGNHIFSRAFAQELERMGYDAIIYKNALEGRGYDSMLLWDASQIRSAYDFFHDDAAGATGLMASLDYVEQDLADRLAGLMAEENMDPNKEAYTFDELAALAGQSNNAVAAGNQRFTPEMATAAPAIRNDLEARLRRMLPSNVAVRFADRLFATNGREQLGRFRPEIRLIEVALAYGEQIGLSYGAHEVVHALRAAGAFTDAEWSMLADRARKVVTLEDEATYRDMYGRQARKMGLPEDLARAFVNRRIEEEYVAHLAQQFFADAKPRFGATIDALLQKIGDILDAIAQAFGAQGFNSPERIFRRMEQGQIAERVEPKRQRAQAPRLPSQIEIDNDVAATKGLWSPAGEPTRAFAVSGRRGSVKITDRADGLQNRVYRVTDEDGNMQAVIALAERDPNLFEVVGVRIAEKARGRGVAIKALTAIEDDLGRPLMQAGIMAADVYEKVAQAMPERVRFHVQGGRAFDGLYLSPRSIDAMDRGAAGVPGDEIAREREIVKRLGAQIPDEHFAIERSADEMAAYYYYGTPENKTLVDVGDGLSGDMPMGFVELDRSAPQPGVPFRVFRLGSATGGLDNRNAGTPLAVGYHLARADDYESTLASAGDTVTEYEVVIDEPTTEYVAFDGGRAKEDATGVGYAKSVSAKGGVLSFPKGAGWTARVIKSVPVSDLRQRLKELTGYDDFDETGSQQAAYAISDVFGVLDEMAAVRPGLDMSPEARKQRAEEMGFDTSRVWYRGDDVEIKAFETHRASKRWTTFSERDVVTQGVMFSPSAEDAKSYGPVVREYYLRPGNMLKDPTQIAPSSKSPASDRDAAAKAWDDVEYILEPEIREIGDGRKVIDTDGGIGTIEVDPDGEWITRAFRDGYMDWSYLDNPEVVSRMRERGYDSVMVAEPNDVSGESIFIIDPTNIRSVNAAFDPAESDSADILSALKPRGMKPRPSHLPSLGDMAKSDVNTEASQSLSDLSTLLLEAIGTQARMGRLNPGLKAAMGRMGAKLYGHYSRATGLIRMAIPGDFVTLVHEGGHALENHHDLGQFVEGIKQAYSAELLPFAGIGQDQLSEGWAEWFRYYMTDPRTAQKKAPTVYGAFRTMLEQNSPELLQALDAVQAGYQQVVASSPAGAVILRTKSAKAEGDGIMREVSEKGLRATVSDRLYGLTRDVTDEKHPLKTAVRFLVNEAMKRGIGGQLTKNQKLWMKAIDDPYKLGRMMEHSRTHATAVLQHGVRRKGRSMPSGPSMQDVLKEAFGGLEKKLWNDERFQQFGAYLVARRMNAEWDRFDAGLLEGAPDHLISRDAWGKAQNDLEQAFPEFKRAARKFDVFMANLLEWKYENGFLTDEQYDELSLRDGYAPLNRIFKNEGPSSLKAKGDNRRKIIYRFRGSTRDFINPIESVIQDVYQTQARVELNDVVKALDKLARNAGPNGGLIAERLPAKDIRVTEMDLTKVHDEMKREAQNILEREARAGTIAKWDVDSILDKLDTLFDQNAAQTLFSAVDTQSKKGERIVYLWENGKRVPILLGSDMLGEDIFNIFASVGKPSDLGAGLEWAVFGTRVFRSGVTKSPPYVAVNWFRDQLQTWALSKNYTPFWSGLKGLTYLNKAGTVGGAAGLAAGVAGSAALGVTSFAIPAVAVYAGAKLGSKYLSNAIKTDNTVAQMYNYWAGQMGGIDSALIDEMSRERDAMFLRENGFFAAPTTFQKALKVMETTEAATRMAHMKQAFDNYIDQGFSEEEAAFEAAYNAHDVMDFSMHGSRMMNASRLVAFLNAQIQGMYATLRTMKGERDDVVTIRDAISPYLKATEGQPLTVVEKAALPNSTAVYLKLMSIGLIGLALSLTYHDDPEHEEMRKSDMGHTHWFFKLAGTWWRVPKPFELAIFSNLFEALFDRIVKDDEMAMQRFLLSIRNTMGFSPEMQAFSAIQTIYDGGRGLLNTITGKPQYGNPKDDLPMRMRGRPPEMQWDAYTSEFSKMLAAVFGISAYKTDRVIRDLGASVGRDLLTVSDYVLPRVNMAVGGRIPGVEKQPRADKSFEDTIFLSRITRRASRGSYSATHFWQDANDTNGRFVMAAKRYKDMMDTEKKPRDAQQFLMSLPDEERAYATLEYHYEEKDEDMHPLNRAKQVILAINAVRRGLANNQLYVQKTDKKGREAKQIVVPPSEQRVLNEILEDIAMREARNSQIVLGKPGWSQMAIMPTDGLWKELHAANADVAEELYWRLTHGRYNTYSFEAVRKVWPEVRQQLLTETPGTSLAGSRSDARIETPRVLPLGP